MNLGEVIKRLEKEDPAKRVPLGWDDWGSWRGSYAQLAFSPASATVREMLDVCRAALTKGEMHGYKGGTYPVSEHTRCNVAYYGSYGGSDDYLTKHGLEYRLSHEA